MGTKTVLNELLAYVSGTLATCVAGSVVGILY